MTKAHARFSIGIDLGTTNSAVAFAPLVGEGTPEILFVPQWDTTGEEPAIRSIALAQPQLHLLNRAARKRTIKGIEHPFPVIRMKVHTAIRRLLPLFETKADVVERNAVGIKALAVGPVHRNNLRREV